jgi:hypothetical protein
MRIKKYDQSIMRRILIGLVTDDSFVARVASQWKAPGLFDSDWANQIAAWCVKHCRNHNKAPRQALSVIFEEWAESRRPDEQVVEAGGSFLSSLAQESQEQPLETAYLLDIASKYFNLVRLKEEVEQVQMDLEEGDADAARTRLRGINAVELGQGSYCEPAKDFSVWTQSLEGEDRRPLVVYPGAVGDFFEGAFLRGELYSFQAPDKTGKSTWLIDFAFRALRRRNNVAFIDTGDSNESEVLVRLGSRMTRRPEFARTVEIPTRWEDDGTIVVSSQNLPGLDPVEAFHRMGKFGRSKGAFRLACFPNSTLSVAGLDGMLADWERGGWRPDVLVVDYVDIMAPPEGRMDGLDQIDTMWKHLKRMTGERHCLIMTATQSKATAYTKGPTQVLGKQDFSGRKTKNAHVNGMIGINVTDDERNVHSARLNWVARRKSRGRNLRKWVSVAGCYDLENPIILSK